MPAGHAGRSAARKLGVTPGSVLALVQAPGAWRPEGIPDGVTVRDNLRGHRDVTVAFVRSERDLRRLAPRLVRALADTSMLWIAWPRRAGGHVSDVTEDLLRAVLLPHGVVDVKVAALDDDWSGLKFVRRVENRA